jgi:hypothetical protein
MNFHATLEQGGKTATGIHVPDEIVSALGSGRRAPAADRATCGPNGTTVTAQPMLHHFQRIKSAAPRAACCGWCSVD